MDFKVLSLRVTQTLSKEHSQKIDDYRVYFLGRASTLAFKCHIHSVCICEHDFIAFRKHSRKVKET